MSAPLLDIRGVSVALAGTRVLDGVDLTVAPNSIVTIVGPNGAGKTTLLRVALGLLAPDVGEVRRRPALRIAYVPQRLAIEPTLPMTVRRFLSLAVSGHVPESRLVEVLESVKAAHILDSQLGEVSGGELQRAMLARAMLRRPELMVLDEPVGGVDVAGQAELYDRIAGLRNETGCGVLMVSHDLHLVMASTDQVVCLNHHVCCAGHPHAVSRDPAYAALFGERVAASLAVYHHRHDHVHAPDGAVAKPREDGAHG